MAEEQSQQTGREEEGDEVANLKAQVACLLEQLHLRDELYKEEMKRKDAALALVKARYEAHGSTVAKEAAKVVAKTAKAEGAAKEKLAVYAEKFDQFQETLAKSNEVFATFKLKLKCTNATVDLLAKEKAGLQRKCEKTDVALIQMVEERSASRKEMETLKARNAKLESLCRALQKEMRNCREVLARNMQVLEQVTATTAEQLAGAAAEQQAEEMKEREREGEEGAIDEPDSQALASEADGSRQDEASSGRECEEEPSAGGAGGREVGSSGGDEEHGGETEEKEQPLTIGSDT